MSVPIQPRFLIKGRAALPLSRRARLIFCALGRGRRKLCYSCPTSHRHADTVEEREEILINFECLQIWKFTFISGKNIRGSNAPRLTFTVFMIITNMKGNILKLFS